MTDYYSMLGLPRGASKAQIKAAYRKLALQWHPDRNPSPEAKQKFIQVTEAYDALMEGRTFPVFRKFTRPAAVKPKPKTPEELRKERLMRYYQDLQMQFQAMRKKYRDSPFAEKNKKRFYREIYFLFVLAGLFLVVPLYIAIRNGSNFFLWFIYPFFLAFAFRNIFRGNQKKRLADMIFGDEEHYSFNELREFFEHE